MSLWLVTVKIKLKSSVLIFFSYFVKFTLFKSQRNIISIYTQCEFKLYFLSLYNLLVLQISNILPIGTVRSNRKQMPIIKPDKQMKRGVF